MISNTRYILLITAFAIAAASCGETEGVVHTTSDPAADIPQLTYDDIGRLSVASNFAVLGEFVGYVDPERGIFEVRMVDDLDDVANVRDELLEAHQAVATHDPSGWCRATIDRDGRPRTGAPGTVEFYTPWGEIDKSIDECLTRIGDDALSETSFPNGVLCADVIIRSFFTIDLENVHAEITSHNGESNQYGYAFPLGSGAERPDFGRARPGVDFGLWSYGNLTTAAPEKKVVWTFKFGSTTPFTFGGRVIYSIAEDCDNSADDDCDGVADNACNEFHVGTSCVIGDDCAGDSFCDGGALDSGAGDVVGACKCNTVDPPYHDGLCSATCGDGTKNGTEEGIDCGGPCRSCGPIETKLVASDAGIYDQFGGSVSVSGDYAIAGARYDSTVGSYTGSAYIFERQGDGTWRQVQKLGASDAAAWDYFAWSVSIDGGRAIVGAKEDDDGGSRSGSAYVFERQPDGTWLQAAKLTASDAAVDDFFGLSVAIHGDHAVVGAHGDDDRGDVAGAAYIFERRGDGTWAQVQKLTASDGGTYDFFGGAVAITAGYAIVSAHLDDDRGANSGSAYIFARQGDGTWAQAQKLTASDGATVDYFGTSVAIAGERAIVGANGDDDRANGSGSAYIFERQAGGNWSQTAKLTASDGAADDVFGLSVAIDGGRAVVGAPWDDDAGTYTGSAYIFARQGDGSWVETDKLTANDAAATTYFGFSVAVDASRVIVGANGDDRRGTDAGAAYVFEF